MLFEDDFVDSVRDDPVQKIILACDLTFQMLDASRHEDGWTDHDLAILLETYSLIVEVIESGLLPIKLKYPSIANVGVSECPVLHKYLVDVRSFCVTDQSKLKVASFRNRFRTSLGSGFAYEFSQGDLERVQTLINQLRELIQHTEHFEKEHQQRLLHRLERLQAEMHKKVSDLDRFWGLIGDAGIVLGKLGNDAKPIVDRIREIADIVWQTQSRAEELPSGTKLPQLGDKNPG